MFVTCSPPCSQAAILGCGDYGVFLWYTTVAERRTTWRVQTDSILSLNSVGEAQMPQKPRSSLVYSTDPDDRPGPAPADAPSYPSAASQTARIWRDSKRRRGKTVTVIGGLRHDPATLEALLKKLKQQCGAGGTLKDGEIEIQGDHRERVAAALSALGYKIKHAGG